MRGDNLGYRLVAGKVRERTPETMDGGEDILRQTGIHPQAEVQLIDGLQVRHFQEQTLPVGQHVGCRDGQWIVAGRAGMARREFGRAVAHAVPIIPRLGEMAFGLGGNFPVNGPGERHPYAVLVDMHRGGKLDKFTGVTHALEAGIGQGIARPALHAGHVQLAILGMKAAAMNA